MDAALDHLIVAAPSLGDGIDYIARVTGVAPRPGGKHVAMGTHNALLRLSDRVYLEVLAVDPDGVQPARPRWFDLDDAELRAELARGPRLVAWAARTDDIEGAVARCPIALGAVTPFTRGDYRWRLTIPDDGRRPASGLMPAPLQSPTRRKSPADMRREENLSPATAASVPPAIDPLLM